MALIRLPVIILLGGVLIAAGLFPAVTAADRITGTLDQRLERFRRELDLSFPRFPERSTIYAADGTPLARLFLEENRNVVHLRNVSDWAAQAVLAIEDADFYQHRGVDYGAIGRAALRNVAAGNIEQGASTITQQLARSVIADVGEDETLSRKMREAYVALRLEERYSKDEILELYVNEVYFGAGAHGIGTAARRYFGKHVRDLNLRESALLAGLIASPERYNPFKDRQAARARRDLVLDRLVETGDITRQRAEQAKRRKLGVTDRQPLSLRQPRAPYFVEFVKREFLSSKRFGKNRTVRERLLYQGGLHIHTTLRIDLQRQGRRAPRHHLPRPNDPNAALVALNPATGAILTLVGGRDFSKQKFDLATQGRRQAGSAFKPFTLVAALNKGFSPRRHYRGTSPVEIELPNGKTWEVENAGGGSYGLIDLRAATRNSVNTVYAQLIMDVGPNRVAQTARRMGIRTKLPAVPSLTLGTAPVSPLEMASAYATIANSGMHCPPFAIRRIVDRAGEPIAKGRPGRCEQRIPREVALQVISMLEQVVQSGTGTAANLPGRRQFGKTGTTDDFGDAWFVGCTRQLCASTWVGHIEARIPMRNVHGIRVYGGTFPARIWRDFMAEAMDGRPRRGWAPPPPMEPPAPGHGASPSPSPTAEPTSPEED